MAKQFKLTAVPFNQLGDLQIKDSTPINGAAVVRHLAALTWLSQNIGLSMEKNRVRDALVVADTIAYPNQALESHRLWAGHVIAAWKRLGVLVEVDA
jgi:hypothetical protein